MSLQPYRQPGIGPDSMRKLKGRKAYWRVPETLIRRYGLHGTMALRALLQAFTALTNI